MTKKEKLNYIDRKPVAIYSCGLVGLELLEVNADGINDNVIYRYTGDNSIHRAKINNNFTGFKSCIGYVSFNNCFRIYEHF